MGTPTSKQTERTAPRTFRIVAGWPDPALLREVAHHLDRGGLIAYPTETLYGFGCALRPDSLERLARLKGRSSSHPFLLLVSGRHQVEELAWSPGAEALAEAFWPGPLTLVLGDPAGRFPARVRSQAGGVAVRMTPHAVPLAIVRRLDEPITSTSANPPGRSAALTGDDALEAAVQLSAGRDMWVLDAGPLEPSDPSTLVDCTGASPALLRRGAVSQNELMQVTPELEVEARDG